MCGIIGIIGHEQVAPLLLDGLRRLEYRGYDSAGIATLDDGQITRCRAEGKLHNLAERLHASPLSGTVGIGHTRWATHGIPNETNAHPHATDVLAVVHNGIIENFQALRDELEAQGFRFETETDTEVVAQLVTQRIKAGAAPVDAFRDTLSRLEGAFALAMIFPEAPDMMLAARRGSPLVIGLGQGAAYLGSDALALAPLTRRLIYLEEGDVAILRRNGIELFDAKGAAVERPVKESTVSGAMIGKGNHRHFMLKEIHEQPSVIGDTLRTLINPTTRQVTIPDLGLPLESISRLTMTACGTAFYACHVARYWFERYAGLPVDIDIASEFRYREAPMAEGGATLCVSQSGETVDTLEALRYAKNQRQWIISIVNTAESAIARESDAVLPTLAGPEIGVASTKAFTTQLTVLAALAIRTGRLRGALTDDQAEALTTALLEVPALVTEILQLNGHLWELAHLLAEARDVLYLGRGTSYPVALEGALKLKEISYIHAEAYAAGEMKHGPIALIDEHVPVIIIAPRDQLFEKTLSNCEQVIARGGKVILLSDREGVDRLKGHLTGSVVLPPAHPFIAPILYTIPAQLLAYHTAVLKGTDVDQPRNLAKSVTVE